MRAFPALSVVAAALLLAALIAALGSEPTAAQSPPGDEHTTVRIVARNADNNRVELGLLEDGQDADSPILPSARFLSWAAADEADVTSWRYSSPIEIGAGERSATVRIAARGLRGERIEFTLQQRGAGGEWSDLPAPQARFFNRSVTHTRWLRSSPLQVAPPQVAPPPAVPLPISPPSTDSPPVATDPPSDGPPTGPVAVVTEQAPAIDAVNCEPDAPTVGETITCSASLSGGAPDSYAWSGGGDPAEGSEASFTTTFDAAGDQTISLTVANTLGDASASTTFAVAEAPTDEDLQAPVIDSISCDPTLPVVGETTTCSAELSGGDPDSYAWSGGDPAEGSEASFATAFDAVGDQTISLTVVNDAGDATQSLTVVVLEPPPSLGLPVIDSLDCSAQLDGVVRCSAAIGNEGPPLSYAWSGGGNPAEGDNENFVTAFNTVGERTISLTVSNSYGAASASTTVAVEQAIQAAAIDNISCSSYSPDINEAITCSANLSGGEPDFYTWRGGGDPPGGNDATFTTTFASAGERTISLRVQNIVGEDSATASVNVRGPLREPVLEGISCNPNQPTVGDKITCSAILSGGPPTTYDWGTWGQGNPATGTGETFQTTFATHGNQDVSLQVSNEYGQSIFHSLNIVVLEPPQAPVIDSLSCEPEPAEVGELVICTATLSGGDPVTYAWGGGSPNGGGAIGVTYTTLFRETGDQTVRFTVINQGGEDSDTTTVTVRPAAPSP